MYKWVCKIRACVLEEKIITHCGECDENPCALRRRLDSNYLSRYKIDLQNNLTQRLSMAQGEWLSSQRSVWNCPHCNSIIDPYRKECMMCHVSHRSDELI